MPRRHRLLGLLLLLGYALSPTWAEEQLPSGRVAFTGVTFGLLVGYTQGRGSLRLHGQDYPFAIKGYQLLSLGAAWMDALGVVYNLERLEDFQGTYRALRGSFTAIQGGGGAVLRNDNGVVIYLQNLNLGVEVSLGGSLDVVLEDIEDAELETPAGTEPTVSGAATAERGATTPEPTLGAP